MKIIAAALLLTVAPLTAHAAENFTFKTTGTAIDGLRSPATGASFQGVQMQNTQADVTFAGGRKSNPKAKCASWRNPPNAQFPQSGICVSAEYEQNYSCQPRGEGKPGVNCWGLLRGTAGAYAGKTGVVAYTSGPEGTEGVGRWND
jgi:hypothetical protein